VITYYRGYSISEEFAGIGKPARRVVRRLSACGVVGEALLGDFESDEQAHKAIDDDTLARRTP
jgi:hypothetical protein